MRTHLLYHVSTSCAHLWYSPIASICECKTVQTRNVLWSLPGPMIKKIIFGVRHTGMHASNDVPYMPQGDFPHIYYTYIAGHYTAYDIL